MSRVAARLFITSLIALVAFSAVISFPSISLASGVDSTFSSTGSGSRKIGFVKIEKGRELFVDYQKPVEGRPTVVLLNGLTYRLGSWDSFYSELASDGLGILRYDKAGQGQTLIKDGVPKGPINYKDQVTDLAKLLDALNIRGPVHLVSLSYGGAIALQFSVDYPERTASIVLMAPFLAPLESQDQWIRTQVNNARALNPYNPATYDELYDFFLRTIVFTTYPAAEPIVLEHPYKLEAIFRLVQGVRKFSAKEIIKQIPPGKLHLVIARQDQYVENEVHEKFWKQLPKATRASLLYIEGCQHKIPEAVPHFSARWVRRIIDGDPELSGGRTFIGNPWLGGTVKQVEN